MELFLAQAHSAMTHLPIALAILASISAVTAMFTARREFALSWALLSIAALVSAVPTVITGVVAAKGRFNGEGKPYLESGFLVDDVPANVRIRRHELLGCAGTGVAAILSASGFALLRGRKPNMYLIALLALALAILWGLGGHLGGKELWGADTFPAFQPKG